MELEYSDKNSKRSKVYLAFGLLMAVLVAGIVFVALQASSLLPQDDVVMRDIVVAARDIPSRKPIEDGDLVMRSVGVDATNDSAMTRSDEVPATASVQSRAPLRAAAMTDWTSSAARSAVMVGP